MATDLQPVHVTATIGPDSSTWPADWPPFAAGNISGGASLGGGISAFRTLSTHHSIIVQYVRNYSAVGNNPGSLRPGLFGAGLWYLCHGRADDRCAPPPGGDG